MRIQHNIMAMNSYRNYNNNVNSLSSNLEKLSSGYRINRAGDDAAGLAISEKMRAQITGLDAAQKNVQDGISLVKTAEGALQEVQDMMNRMVYLATQSANGTYDNDVDRNNLQKEVTALMSEINRIADSANFNGQELLDGSLGGPETAVSTLGVDGVTAASAVTAVYTFDASTAEVTYDGTTATVTIGGFKAEFASNTSAGTGTATTTDLAGWITAYNSAHSDTFMVAANGTTATQLDFTAKTAGAVSGVTDFTGAAVSTAGKDAVAGVTAVAAEVTVDFANKTYADMIGGTVTFDGKTYEFVDTGATPATANATAVEITAGMTDAQIAAAFAGVEAGDNFSASASGTVVTLQADTAELKTEADVKLEMAGMGLTLQIGDTSDSFNQLKVSVNDMHTDTLGISGVNIQTLAGAQEAIDKIKTAINTVSSQRGDLGAIQNRLEHTANNLSVMEENITNAESAIRDTDVADEMMAYTKNNILIQAAQAMLAQANAVPQGVLQLLQ